MKLCTNCRHHRPDKLTSPRDNFDVCGRREVVSPVDGVVRSPRVWCSIERTLEQTGCGPDARFFEPKPAQDQEAA